MMRITVTAMAFALCLLHGQEWGDGRGEVYAMSGVAAGGLGTRVVVTGGASASISRYFMASAEASVIPLNNQTLIPSPAFAVRGSDLFDFNVSLQVRIPIKRWEPYALVAPGVLMNPYTAGFQTASGAVAYVGERHSKFGLAWGAGGRYYVRDHWGVRAEYRYTSSVKNFNRVLGGVFYQTESPYLFGLLPALSRHLRR